MESSPARVLFDQALHHAWERAGKPSQSYKATWGSPSLGAVHSPPPMQPMHPSAPISLLQQEQDRLVQQRQELEAHIAHQGHMLGAYETHRRMAMRSLYAQLSVAGAEAKTALLAALQELQRDPKGLLNSTQHPPAPTTASGQFPQQGQQPWTHTASSIPSQPPPRRDGGSGGYPNPTPVLRPPIHTTTSISGSASTQRYYAPMPRPCQTGAPGPTLSHATHQGAPYPGCRAHRSSDASVSTAGRSSEWRGGDGWWHQPASRPASVRGSTTLFSGNNSDYGSVRNMGNTEELLRVEVGRYQAAFRAEQRRARGLEATLQAERARWGAERANLRYNWQWCGRWCQYVPCLEPEGGGGMAVCMHWHLGDQDAPPEVLDLLAFFNPDSTHPQLPAPSSTWAAGSSIGTTTPHDAPSDSSSVAGSWPRHAPPSPRSKLREREPPSPRYELNAACGRLAEAQAAASLPPSGTELRETQAVWDGRLEAAGARLEATVGALHGLQGSLGEEEGWGQVEADVCDAREVLSGLRHDLQALIDHATAQQAVFTSPTKSLDTAAAAAATTAAAAPSALPAVAETPGAASIEAAAAAVGEVGMPPTPLPVSLPPMPESSDLVGTVGDVGANHNEMETPGQQGRTEGTGATASLVLLSIHITSDPSLPDQLWVQVQVPAAPDAAAKGTAGDERDGGGRVGLRARDQGAQAQDNIDQRRAGAQGGDAPLSVPPAEDIERVLRHQAIDAQLETLKAAKRVSHNLEGLQATQHGAATAQHCAAGKAPVGTHHSPFASSSGEVCSAISSHCVAQPLAEDEGATGSMARRAGVSTGAPPAAPALGGHAVVDEAAGSEERRLTPPSSPPLRLGVTKRQSHQGTPGRQGLDSCGEGVMYQRLESVISETGGSEVDPDGSIALLSELGAGGLVEMVGYFRQELQEAEFEILQLSAQVDALSAANSAAATGSLFRDRELERLALSESDALSEVSRLRAQLSSEREARFKLRVQCEELQRRVAGMSSLWAPSPASTDAGSSAVGGNGGGVTSLPCSLSGTPQRGMRATTLLMPLPSPLPTPYGSPLPPTPPISGSSGLGALWQGGGAGARGRVGRSTGETLVGGEGVMEGAGGPDRSSWCDIVRGNSSAGSTQP